MPIENGYHVVEQDYRILTSHGMMTEEQLKAFNQSEQERKNSAFNMTERKPIFCPFRGTVCNENCALHESDSCRLCSTVAEKDTKGLSCPFTNAVCVDSCGVYNKGCTLGGKNDNE